MRRKFAEWPFLEFYMALVASGKLRDLTSLHHTPHPFMSLNTPHFSWNAEETLIIRECIRSGVGLKAKQLLEVTAARLRAAGPPVRSNFPMEKLKNKISNEKAAMAKSHVTIQDSLAEFVAEDDAPATQAFTRRANPPAARPRPMPDASIPHPPPPKRAQRVEIFDDDGESDDDLVSFEVHSADVARPSSSHSLSTASASTSPSSSTLPHSPFSPSNASSTSPSKPTEPQHAANAPSFRMPSPPQAVPQPAPDMLSSKLPQPLNRETQWFLEQLRLILPAGMLIFLQYRTRPYPCIVLGFIIHPNFKLSLVHTREGFIGLKQTPISLENTVQEWASALDFALCCPLQGAHPTTEAPHLPAVLYLPLHPQQNTNSRADLYSPAALKGPELIWTLVIHLLDD